MAERLNCSSASLQMLKNDLSAAAGKYLTIEADEISVTITHTTPVILTAKIPLKRNEEYHVKTI
jgi:septum formation topological specificity factor MinE